MSEIVQNTSTDPIFVEEQQHLTEIYAKLLAMRDEIADKLEHEHAKAASDLRALSDEIRPDYGGADETMETLAAIETLNLVIDAYNQYHDISVDKLRRVLLLLRQPYFAKVRLKMASDHEAEDIYIGAVGMTDENSFPFIVDWRNPIAETYYNQDNGKTSYVVNGRTRNVDLELRRQFDISRDVLNMYFDTSVAIEDSLLLGALRSQHSEKLRNITATIQREQNEVVRHSDVDVLLVSGIAGSGKTSVMLQRIAYLLYQEREKLSANQVHLFGPNTVFEHYIDNVLPSMGEANPHLYTWRVFCEQQGAGERDLGANTDPARLRQLETALTTTALQQADLREIRCEGQTLLKTNQIFNAIQKNTRFGLGPRFCALVCETLHTRLEQRISQMANKEELQEEVMGFNIETQIEIFGETIAPNNDEELKNYTRRWLTSIYGKAHDDIEQLAWLKLDRIGMRMLDAQALSASELIYLRLLLTGQGDPKARFVMIDEVQDYTLTQLMVLARYFNRAHFLLLGDENQAITEGTVTFAQIRALFEEKKKVVNECRLLTSYRSSPEITALFSGFVDIASDVKLASVQREGVAAHIEALSSKNDFLAALTSLVDEAYEQSSGLCALVANDDGAVSWLAKNLDEQVQVIKNDQELPATGVVLLPLRLAKGLEFDHVIIPDASAEVYPDTPLSRRRLYTAVSRATHRVTLLAQGKLSPLLA